MFGLKSKQQKIIDKLNLDSYRYYSTLCEHTDPVIRQYIISEFVKRTDSSAYYEAQKFFSPYERNVTREEKMQVMAMFLRGLESADYMADSCFGSVLSQGIDRHYIDFFCAWAMAQEKEKPGQGAKHVMNIFENGGRKNADARTAIFKTFSEMLKHSPSAPLIKVVCEFRVDYHDILPQEKEVLFSGLAHAKEFLGKDHIRFLYILSNKIPKLSAEQADLLIDTLGRTAEHSMEDAFYYVPMLLRSRSGEEGIQDGICEIFERAVRAQPEKMGKELHNFLNTAPGIHPRAQARLTRLFSEFRNENVLDATVMAVEFLKKEKTTAESRAPMIDIVCDSKNASARLAFLAANKLLVEASNLDERERGRLIALAVEAMKNPGAMEACADTVAGAFNLGSGEILTCFVKNLLTQAARTDAAPPEKIKSPKA